MKNPMLTFSTLAIFGAWLGAILPNNHFVFIVLIIIFTVSIKLMRNKVTYKSIPFLFILAIIVMFSTGLFRANYVRRQNLSIVAPFANEQVKIFGEVLSFDVKNTYTIVELYTYRFEHNSEYYRVQTKVNLIIYDTVFKADIRDVIVTDGFLQLYSPMSFWGETGDRSYYASKGVFANIISNSSNTNIIGSNKRTIDLLVLGQTGREHIKKTINKYLSGDEGALMKGILIGDKQDFSGELKDAFRLSGMSHIVAVSGLHVGIFIIFISFGAFGILSNRKWRVLLLLIAIFSYTIIIGTQPSILRAALMASYGIVIENAKLRRDSSTALMNVTAFLAFVNPYLLHNTGFQLSFLATLGIVLLDGRFFRYKVANAGVAAFLFTSPLLAYSFNTITFASLITNILVSPLVIISLLLGYILCIIPFTGFILSPILFCITHVMILISKFFASIKILTINVASPSFIVLICCFTALFILYQLIIGNRKRMRTLFASTVFIALLTLTIFNSFISTHDININFVAVQNGDGVHIKTPNGYNLLVDAGNGPDIHSFLKKKNIRKLDAVILTNLKSEDTDGVQYLLKQIPITTIYMPYNNINFDKNFTDKAAEIRYFEQGDRLTIDNISFDILKHDPYAETLSNSSAAIKMKCYDTGIMLLGDFNSKFELDMIESNNIDAIKSDIVRLANHGDRYSNSYELIKAMSVKYAIVNIGYNKKEKLSDEVYYNLLINKTKPLKTYHYGTIGFTVNKNGIKYLHKTRIPLEEDL